MAKTKKPWAPWTVQTLVKQDKPMNINWTFFIRFEKLLFQSLLFTMPMHIQSSYICEAKVIAYHSKCDWKVSHNCLFVTKNIYNKVKQKEKKKRITIQYHEIYLILYIYKQGGVKWCNTAVAVQVFNYSGSKTSKKYLLKLQLRRIHNLMEEIH